MPEIKKLVDKKAQKPKMLKDDRNTLKTIYLEDIKKLKTILKRELPWDDFNNLGWKIYIITNQNKKYGHCKFSQSLKMPVCSFKNHDNTKKRLVLAKQIYF